MKRMIGILIMTLFIITGCSNIQNSSIELSNDVGIDNDSDELLRSSIVEDNKSLIDWKHIVIKQADGQSGMFYLGMTLNDLNSLDLYNTDNEITETIELEDGQTAVWTPILCLVFNKEGILYKITVNGDLPTPIGLKNGDSIDLLESLLGKSDNTYIFASSNVEEYNVGDFYFYANINEETVSLWGISSYKYDYKDEQSIGHNSEIVENHSETTSQNRM
ncbi:hypothetical protein [Cohnella mopanensis]|uniref:hypothetical protein n=1 Tax=Cohnella mopanensis TaxID=2911966 RepID=UPI001EF7E853|nr:hypothetical protein [Cohnella mopanensis]